MKPLDRILQILVAAIAVAGAIWGTMQATASVTFRIDAIEKNQHVFEQKVEIDRQRAEDIRLSVGRMEERLISIQRSLDQFPPTTNKRAGNP